MSVLVHTVHVILAGAWLGGVLFTTAVVTPALRAMKWSEAERVGVRSSIGRRYARVGAVNLVLLLVFAVSDGSLGRFEPVFYAEGALLAVLFGLVAAHGAYFGRRLAGLAEAERRVGSAEEARALAEKRRSLQKRSLLVSRLDLAVSVAIVALAANA